MNKQAQTKIKSHLLKKALIYNQKIVNELQEFVTGQKMKKNESTINLRREVIRGVDVNEVSGELISSDVIQGPFDDGSILSTVKANLATGTESTYYAMISEAQKTTGELNFSTVMGKWFGVNYNILPNPQYVHAQNVRCCSISKVMRINPFSENVFVKAKTVATLPEDPEFVYYVQIGNANVQTAGVQADFQTSLSYLDNNNAVISAHTADLLVRSIKSSQIGDSDYYNPSLRPNCMLKLPAGTSEFVYTAYVIGRAFTSNDILQLDPEDTNEFVIALLDLRNQTKHRNFPILRDPLNSWNKEPFGGIKLNIELEFYEAATSQLVYSESAVLIAEN